MVKPKDQNQLDGYQSTRDGELHDIHIFTKPGEVLKGTFYGVKVLPSNYSKEGSKLWMIKPDGQDEIVLVNEKATMIQVRIEKLTEGMDIAIIYHGEKQGKNRKYKDFEVLIKETSL